MYTYLKEITDWGEQKVPNHTYIFNDKNQNVGYIKTGTKEEIFYGKPSKLFSKSRRKFIKLDR
jgi:hypothetical protein|tara:strand:- start:25 stop:213 length:189 start_codon:yes stop_codon:yes gene_type:complete